MAIGRDPRQRLPAVARVPVAPVQPMRALPTRKDWTERAGWLLHPGVRSFVEQFIVAGPIFGVLSALYWFHLQQDAPLTPDPASHAVLREVLSFHGRFLHAYYITPGQHALWLALALPGVVWLMMVVGGVMALGIRSHFRPRG